MNDTNIIIFLERLTTNANYQGLIVLATGLILSGLVNLLLRRVINGLARNARATIINLTVSALRPALFYTIQIISLAIAIHLVFADRAGSAVFSILQTLSILVWSAFALRLSRSVLRAISKQAHRPTIISGQTLPLFENLANILIIAVAVYFIFVAWQIDMTAWLASAGIVGIAVGFAAKDTLANLFSGVFILADAPYRIGDYVVLDTGERGEVTHIGIRSTRILTRDDIEVTIPNSIMGNTKIINESGGPHKKFRIRVKVGVAYGTDVEKVRQLLLNIAVAEESVCLDPEPRVRFRQFGASSLDLELLCWVDEPMLRGRVVDRLNTDIYNGFNREGIEIPYSKHDVFIKQFPANNDRGQKSS